MRSSIFDIEDFAVVLNTQAKLNTALDTTSLFENLDGGLYNISGLNRGEK
jgi:hypothetical protein